MMLRQSLGALFAAGSMALACMLAYPSSAQTMGSLIQVDIVDRFDGRELPVYSRHGVHWIEGVPGHEYAIRVRNRTGGRLVAIMSVDGVNVITGETASPSQSGYVLDPYGSTEIAGWRKSFAQTAAFYFTELPDAYATRTGRPDNLGVIGLALFRERAEPVVISKPQGKLAAPAERDAAANAESSAKRDDGASDRRENAARAAAAPAAQLGTGHGRIESSRAERVAFERATSAPTETITIRYDRRENLAALGILPPPILAHYPRPFPADIRFTPDPPR